MGFFVSPTVFFACFLGTTTAVTWHQGLTNSSVILTCDTLAELRDQHLVTWYRRVGGALEGVVQLTPSTWRKFSNVVRVNARSLSADPEGKLTLMDLQAEDAGSYECHVTSPLRRLISEHMLFVQDVAVDVTGHNRVGFGTTTNFSCTVDPNSTQVISMSWSFQKDKKIYPLFVYDATSNTVTKQSSDEDEIKDLLDRTHTSFAYPVSTLFMNSTKVADDGSVVCDFTFLGQSVKAVHQYTVTAVRESVTVRQSAGATFDEHEVTLTCDLPQAGRPAAALSWEILDKGDIYPADNQSLISVKVTSDEKLNNNGLLHKWTSLVIAKAKHGKDLEFRCLIRGGNAANEDVNYILNFYERNETGGIVGVVVCVLVGIETIVLLLLLTRYSKRKNSQDLYHTGNDHEMRRRNLQSSSSVDNVLGSGDNGL